MKAHFFHAFVCLVFIFAIIFIGFGLYLVPTAPDWIFFLTEKLNNDPQFFSQIGKALLLSGAGLLFLFYWMSRKTFYSVIIEPSLSYTLHSKMLNKIISDFLKEGEVSEKIPFKLNVYGQKLEILADLSKISFTEHERILGTLESKLGKLIEKQAGLPKEVTVTVLSHKA